MEPRRADIRNIAIIAHVDHGKTTLVDALLRQTGQFLVKPEHSQEQVLDSSALERERGITILAKNTAVPYRGVTINIVDTPGHADFGSEVERVLKMVDGALLLVDAVDGPMPQTKFVLRKALQLGLAPIVVINKLDRPNARPHWALDQVFSLFMDLGASDPQLDFPFIFAAGKQGWASPDPNARTNDLAALFEAILTHVPPPLADVGKPFQMLITMLDHSPYVGKIGIGRIANGHVRKAQAAVLVRHDGTTALFKVARIEKFIGLKRLEVEEAQAGDIAAIAGLEEIQVGETLASPELPKALPPLEIDAPTLSMEFMVNDGPFAGREGKFVTGRHLRERLLREARTNVGMRIEELPGEGRFKVSGRGELHLSILIETMRREGFELAVSRPEVIYRQDDGRKFEPMEFLVIDLQREYQGAVYECLGRRGAIIENTASDSGGHVRLESVLPARSLIGFKGEFLTLTRGTGVMHHSFHGYAPASDAALLRPNGVLIAKEEGQTTGYALQNLQERGVLFLGDGIPVYPGMIIGQNSRDNDLVVNPCKQKQLTNMRSKATDEAIALTPPRQLTLEQAIEFLAEDELLEVTPKSLRLRKKILNRSMRKRSERDREED